MLERSRTLKRGPDQHQEILRAAIQQLSNEDLKLLGDLVVDERWRGELTEQESAAVHALTSLFEQEAQRAGYHAGVTGK